MFRSQYPMITFSNLNGIQKLLVHQNWWRPDVDSPFGDHFKNAVHIFSGYRYMPEDITTGVDETIYANYPRALLDEEIWFMQCALREICPAFRGSIWQYFGSRNRVRREFIELVDLAMILCLVEFKFDEVSL